MIGLLQQIEKERIVAILSEPIENFKTLYIDYEKPYVSRLQYDLGDGNKLSFHKIESCDTNEALYHPHPWPSAIHVIRGSYEMGISYSEHDYHYKPDNADNRYQRDIQENEVCRIVAPENLYYEMLNPYGWHYVKPLDGCSMSVMLMGPKWYKGSQPTKTLHALDPVVADKIREEFLEYFLS